MDEKFYEDLKEKIQPYFEEVGSHSFDHTERVYNLAVRIAESENVDLNIVKVSVLLHDIARKKQDECEGEICHAEEGAKMAEEILNEINFPKEQINKICEAIKIHRLSKGIHAETDVAKILQDADRLDSLGAILIARSFSSGSQYKRPFYDSSGGRSVIKFIEDRNAKILPDNFNTETAKEFARKRYDFAQEFVERFKKEMEGEL